MGMAGKFIGIGVGPGDPELITFKAAKALHAADVICVPKSHAQKPSMALGMVKQLLSEREKPVELLALVFPMKKDELELNPLWAKNADLVASEAKADKTLAFITLGDPMLYSTFQYLYRSLKDSHPEVELEIIPGVTSVTAAAASAKLPLAEKEEVVSIMPSNLDAQRILETAKHADSLVFMKSAHRIKALIPTLQKAGFTSDATVALVKRCTLPEEEVLTGRLGDVQGWEVTEDYFSVAIVKRTPFPSNRQVNET